LSIEEEKMQRKKMMKYGLTKTVALQAITV